MKAIVRTVIIFIPIFYSYLSIGQSLYKPGFVVKNNGDTIQGMIEYRQWEKNPDIIQFRLIAPEEKPISYTIADLNYFEITGLDRYVKAVVMKDTRPVELNELLKFANDTVLRDTVFLRVLFSADLSLYQYYDSKPHYYIKVQRGDYQELLYKVYLFDSDTRLSKNYIFRDQLKGLLATAGKSNVEISQLKTAEYRERDILKLVTKLNSILYYGSYSYTIPKPKQYVSFYAGAGLTYSSLKYEGPRDNLSNLDYTSGMQPLVLAGVDVAFGRNLQQLVLRTELCWYSLRYEGSNRPGTLDTVTYNLKANNLSPSLSVLYNFINRANNKAYLGLGLAYNLMKYSENTLQKKYTNTTSVLNRSPHLNLEKGWMSLHARAGYIFRKRIEFSTTVKLGGSFSNYSNFGLNSNIVNTSINYRF